jgi:transposase InsO family protein
MTAYIKAFVARCLTCQIHKTTNRTPIAPLQPIVASEPWEVVHIDVTGPLTCTQSNNRYIIVLIDHFSKWVECVATPNFTAQTTAACLMDRIICRFGAPQRIITDRGTNFESSLFQSLCQIFQIAKLRATSYHPMTSGQVERQNRTINQCFHATSMTLIKIGMSFFKKSLTRTTLQCMRQQASRPLKLFMGARREAFTILSLSQSIQ